MWVTCPFHAEDWVWQCPVVCHAGAFEAQQFDDVMHGSFFH